MKEKEDKKQNVPKRRFPGFTEPWEQRKVRDVANRYDNLRVPVAANLRVSGTTPYYGANGIQDYVEGYTHEGEFVLVAEDGANDLKNYPVKCVNGRIWVNNHAHVLQGKAKIADNQFLAYSINQADIESLLVGGSRAKLNAETLMDIELTLPSLPEQQEIGAYLKHLDNLITLHQRKLDDLKLLKKGLLQKMFPKNGEKIPEIRFPGFTDDWEQRRLGDIANTFKGGGTPKTSVKEYWDGTLPWIQSSDLLKDKLFENIPNKFITEEGLKNSATKLIEANSIAIVTRVGVGKVSFFPYDYATSQDFISFSNLNVDPKFGTYLCYRTLNHINDLQGSAIKGITGESVKLFDITLPNMIEQKQIGKFLYQFDHLITLHQRKLDNLKLLKKGLLQEMFV